MERIHGRRAFLAVLGVLAVAPRASVAAPPPPICEQEPSAKIQPASQDVAEASVVGGVLTPTNVKLNGSPSKGDTYSWQQTAGPTVTLVGANTDHPSFTAPDVLPLGATLRFTLTVTGCDGTSPASAEAIVNVSDVATNRAPIASATATPATVGEGGAFTLDGSASSDPDAGDVLSFTWEQLVDGHYQFVSNLVAVPLTAPEVVPYPGGATLTFRLTVSDGHLTSTAVQLVNVSWVNDPPQANAACTSEVNEGADVTLDGIGSTDGDDGIAVYEWKQTTGGPIAALPAEALSLPVFSFDAPALEHGHGDTMTFSLTVTDHGGLSDSAECSVRVLDVTPPVLTMPTGNVKEEATSRNGAVVTFDASATDAFDGDVAIVCSSSSGDTFPLGLTTVSCSASDKAGNLATGTFIVEVVDTTPPVLSLPANLTEEATSKNGAAVTFASSALDTVDGDVPVTCSPASGNTFALDVVTTVSCSASDAAGNTATGTFSVEVLDRTGPTVTVPENVTTGPTQWNGAVVTYGGAWGEDLVDGTVAASCLPESGSLFEFGTTAVTCTSTDAHGNQGKGAFTVTVSPFTVVGFFQPVDNLPALNTVKNGATVPLKWRLHGEGGVLITDVRAVASTRTQRILCGSDSTLEQPIEMTTTGGTSLRYDSTAAQFIFNWQTPKQAATCWRVDVTFTDGTAESANFKLK
jgi:HYR domain/K319L-like, PKD domain